MDKSKKKNTRTSLCAIPNCKNNFKTHPNIAYHLFPKDVGIRKAWISKCQGMDKFNPLTSRICSKHFSSDDYIRDLRNELLGMPTRKKLKPTSIPSLFLPSSVAKKQVKGAALVRPLKLKKKETKKIILKSTPSVNEIQITKNENVSNLKMSTVLHETGPNGPEKTIDWKDKYKKLLGKYAKLEEIAVYWQNQSKRVQPKKIQPKRKPKLTPKEQKKTKITELHSL